MPQHCACAGTLLLRRVLRRDNPAHQALLDTEAAARGIRIEQGAPDGASNTARPGVKRERGGGCAVDLTAGLTACAPIDPTIIETCDLTADDCAPAWSAKRRPPPAVVVVRL